MPDDIDALFGGGGTATQPATTGDDIETLFAPRARKPRAAPDLTGVPTMGPTPQRILDEQNFAAQQEARDRLGEPGILNNLNTSFVKLGGMNILRGLNAFGSAASGAGNQYTPQIAELQQQAEINDPSKFGHFTRGAGEFTAGLLPAALGPVGLGIYGVTGAGNAMQSASDAGVGELGAATAGVAGGVLNTLIPGLAGRAVAPVAGRVAQGVAESLTPRAGQMAGSAITGGAVGTGLTLGQASIEATYNPEQAWETVKEIPTQAGIMALLMGAHGGVSRLPPTPEMTLARAEAQRAFDPARAQEMAVDETRPNQTLPTMEPGTGPAPQEIGQRQIMAKQSEMAYPEAAPRPTAEAEIAQARAEQDAAIKAQQDAVVEKILRNQMATEGLPEMQRPTPEAAPAEVAPTEAAPTEEALTPEQPMQAEAPIPAPRYKTTNEMIAERKSREAGRTTIAAERQQALKEMVESRQRGEIGKQQVGQIKQEIEARYQQRLADLEAEPNPLQPPTVPAQIPAPVPAEAPSELPRVQIARLRKQLDVAVSTGALKPAARTEQLRAAVQAVKRGENVAPVPSARMAGTATATPRQEGAAHGRGTRVAPAPAIGIQPVTREAEAPRVTPAPKLSVSPVPKPLPEHQGLKGVEAVLDPARRPPPPDKPFRHPMEQEAAVGGIGPYKGNKREGLGAIVDATRGAFGKDADKVTSVVDAFGGSGGYGLATTINTFPNVKHITVQEITPGRLAKIKFLHENGSQLRERADATGMLDAIRSLWEEMAAKGSNSGGGVQGRASDAVIEKYFEPDQPGGKHVAENGLDLDEAKAIIYSYVDGMKRGRADTFDELLINTEKAAYDTEVAANAFTSETTGGKIDYKLADSFTSEYPTGPETVVLVDGPYAGTTGYGAKRGEVGGADLYRQTADLLERLKAQKNGIVYTDEAWWAKTNREGQAAVPAELGKQLDPMLQRAQAATDYWSFYNVGKRTESVAVTNGFRPSAREEASHIHGFKEPPREENAPVSASKPQASEFVAEPSAEEAPAAPAPIRAPPLARVSERAAAPGMAKIGFDDVRAQIERLPISQKTPGLADATMALIKARAETAGIPVDEYISKRLAGVQSSQGQGKRGTVQFLDDGRAVIHAFENADPTTVLHELVHIFRRDITGAHLALVEGWVGVKDGRWTRANEEKFAKAGETYFHTGEAPTPALKTVFERFANWFKTLYGAVRTSLPPDIQGVFDGLFKGAKEPSKMEPMKVEAPPVEQPKKEASTAETPATPGENIVGIKNEFSAQQRQQLGLPERETPETRSFEEMYSRGKAVAESSPDAIDELITELRRNPERMLSDTEVGLMVKHAVDRENELQSLLNKAEAAKSSGNSTLEKALHEQLEQHREESHAVIALMERAGTASARALAARKIMSSLDYTLSKMEAVAKESKGSALTEQETKSITRLHQELKASSDKLQEQLGTGNASGAETLRLRTEVVAARRRWTNRIKELQSVGKSTGHRISDAIRAVPGVAKSLKASLDDSAVFRQGWGAMFSNPGIWGRNALRTLDDAVRSLGGEHVMDRVEAELEMNPYFQHAKQAKLAIGVSEEAFPSSLPERIPLFGRLFKASEAAYTAFVYRTRMHIFEKVMDTAKQAGVDIIDKAQLHAVAKVVNSLTGRGSLGRLEPMGGIINNLFFSGRKLKGDFDTLTAHTFDRNLTSFARKQALQNLAKRVAGTATIMMIAHALRPDTAELDPRSTDFGKIKSGNTRFDVTGGSGALVVLASRLAALGLSHFDKFSDLNSFKSSTTGKLSQINSGKFGAKTGTDLMESFATNKLSPIASVVVSHIKGTRFGGGKPTLKSDLVDLLVPMSAANLVELMQDQGATFGSVARGTIADFFGIGTNTYGKTPFAKAKTP